MRAVRPVSDGWTAEWTQVRAAWPLALRFAIILGGSCALWVLLLTGLWFLIRR